MSQTLHPKRKSDNLWPECQQACGMQETRCVCIAARDRLVEALIPPSTPLCPYEREEIMLEFSTARTWCPYCEPELDGMSVCSCFEARKRAWEMKGAQVEPMFPSLFAIRAADIEEELAGSRCRYCTSEAGNDYKMFDERLPPLRLMKWTRDAHLQPQRVFVDERLISPPCARIARTPPLDRPRVLERVAGVE